MASYSDGSLSSTRTSASRWGVEDDEVKWTGVHLRVLGGRPVWPLAFHLFMTAGDRREFVEQRMESVDFVPARYAPGSAVARHLEEILEGDCDWVDAQLSVSEADCVLASLGLLHMRVKCVIPEELGGNYEPAVSACATRACVAGGGY
jgi:hypothetical protein